MEAALEARRELGKEYEPDIVDAMVEKIERREEMSAALRSRSLEQARQLLAGETSSAAPSEPPTPPVASRPPRPPPASATRPHESPESTMEVSVEEIEIDLAA